MDAQMYNPWAAPILPNDNPQPPSTFGTSPLATHFFNGMIDAVKNLYNSPTQRPDTSQENILFRTASPFVNITDQDINRGMNVAMAAGPGSIRGYHGSPLDVEALKAGTSGNYGPATYFHTAAADAERYRPEGGKVYEADLNIQKPFEMDKPVNAQDAAAILRGMGNNELADKVAASGKGYFSGNELWYWGLGQGKSQAEKAAALKAAGYDSLIGDPGREITGTSTRSPEIAVYNDKLIDVLRKYGLVGFMAPPILAGAANEQKQ